MSEREFTPREKFLLWTLSGSSPKVIRKWENNFNQSLITALFGNYIVVTYDGPGQKVLHVIGAVMAVLGSLGLIYSVGRGTLAFVFRRVGGITHVTVYEEFFNKREGDEPSVQVQRLRHHYDNEEEKS